MLMLLRNGGFWNRAVSRLSFESRGNLTFLRFLHIFHLTTPPKQRKIKPVDRKKLYEVKKMEELR